MVQVIIVIEGRPVRKWNIEKQVMNLNYSPANANFYMMTFDYDQPISVDCELDLDVKTIVFDGAVTIVLATLQDATLFAEWLDEADAKVRHGFHHMAG